MYASKNIFKKINYSCSFRAFRSFSTILVDKGILDVVEGEFPVEDLEVLLLSLEDLVEVLTHHAHWILVHHVRTRCSHQGFLQGLFIGDDDL